jgi:hypothetical protein
LKFEIDQAGVHPAKWEKKGAALYTTRNVTKYPELRKATNRLLNQINNLGGFGIYVGTEKVRSENLDSKELFHSTLIEIIKRLDEECIGRNDQFMVILDEQEENVMRGEIVERTSIEMFGANNRKHLIEPRVQAESHLYQTLQCADWLCGLFGRMAHLQFEPEHKKDFEWVDTYFKARLDAVCKRSGVRPTSHKPASLDSLDQLVSRFHKSGD